MRSRYKGRHRKEPYGRSIGQITVEDLKQRNKPSMADLWWTIRNDRWEAL